MAATAILFSLLFWPFARERKRGIAALLLYSTLPRQESAQTELGFISGSTKEGVREVGDLPKLKKSRQLLIKNERNLEAKQSLLILGSCRKK